MHTGLIYIAICRKTHIVKIGFSKVPKRRLASVSSEQRRDFYVAATMPGNLAEEQKLHRALRSYRLEAIGPEYYPIQILSREEIPSDFRERALTTLPAMPPKNPLGRPREIWSKKPTGRRVLALKMKGLSYSEIGAKLGISKQYAHQVYTRVRGEMA